MKKLTVLKIGGKLLENDQEWRNAMADFANIKGTKVLVHGGGRMATDLCDRLGIKTTMVQGRRITDSETLEVAIMVYAGLLNKQLVSYLQFRGVNAMGLSGADGNLILSQKRPAGDLNYGWVGDVKKLNKPLLLSLLSQNIVPVFSAITHNGSGQLLNTNADTIASVLAATLAKDYQVTLKFCLEKNGVLSDPADDNSTLPNLSPTAYLQNKHKGTISAGMIPKIDNAFDAKRAGAHLVMICGTRGINHHKGTEICL